MDWRLLTALVCSFGFFKDMRPSEAYLTSYLTGEWKNLTVEEVDNEIYPWWTYSYLVWLAPVFLITDYFRYKPMIVIDGAAYIATWALLLWADGVPAMKMMQVTFGLASAGEIAYISYMYVKVDHDRFKIVTSYIRAASLLGKFVAYFLGQMFVSFEVLDFFGLHIFSFVSVSIAFLISISLPSARYSEIFHTNKETKDATASETAVNENIPPKGENSYTLYEKLKTGVVFMITELKVVYSSKQVVIWSVWWAFASCGNFQVGNYIQNMWKVISPDRENHKIYNGAVEAAGTLFSSFSVLLIGYLPIDWSVRGKGESLMALVCGLNAAVLVGIATTTEIWVAYVLYDVFRATYQTVITIATAQIARSLGSQRYGFVFGCNMFAALLIETILTAIVVDKAGLGVDVQTQFYVYGGYFGVMCAVFIIVVLYNALAHGCWCMAGGDTYALPASSDAPGGDTYALPSSSDATGSDSVENETEQTF